MRAIYKYSIKLQRGLITINMPAGAQILEVAEQVPYKGSLWALVDTEAPVETYSFFIVFTGEPIELNNNWRFIKTFQTTNGLVWHIFLHSKGET